MTDDHTHRGDDVHPVEAAEREANGGWKPIDTAPKGLDEILVSSCEGVQVAWRCHSGFGYWANPIDGSEVHGDPTHWMPLPAAPTEGE
jgi:hypothetical protein